MRRQDPMLPKTVPVAGLDPSLPTPLPPGWRAYDDHLTFNQPLTGRHELECVRLDVRRLGVERPTALFTMSVKVTEGYHVLVCEMVLFDKDEPKCLKRYLEMLVVPVSSLIAGILPYLCSRWSIVSACIESPVVAECHRAMWFDHLRSASGWTPRNREPRSSDPAHCIILDPPS